MSEISKVTSPDVDSNSYVPPADVTAAKEATQKAVKGSSDLSTDLNELLKNDPKLQGIFDNVLNSFTDQPADEVFSIQRVIRALIDLSQALQSAALAESDRLNKVTERLNLYAQMESQLPVITGTSLYPDSDKGRQDKQDANTRFGTALESLRSNQGLEQDRAKKIQTILQTMKDAGSSVSDYIGSFTDLFRTISSKITQ